jgi:putative ABC transport system substrate-binding protein
MNGGEIEMATFMRRVLSIAAVVMVMAVLAPDARAEKKIGVLLFSDEVRYQESRNGILDQLKKAGFGEPAVKYLVENAGGNKAKAAELAQKLNAAKPDMIVVVGTSAAVAVAKEAKTIPIVFSMVYDPVDSKIAESWMSSGNNTTGASPRVPMAKLLDELKQLSPVKRLAVLYTPGEKNSETQLKEIQAEQASAGMKVVPVPLSTKEEVSQMIAEVVGSSDAIYLTGSSIVGSCIALITDTATKAKVITVTHLDDYVDKGVMLGVCANPYAVGQLAGEKAVKVLKGVKPSSVPIEALKKMDVILNAKTARAAQIPVPAAFKATVTKTIE